MGARWGAGRECREQGSTWWEEAERGSRGDAGSVSGLQTKGLGRTDAGGSEGDTQ